MRKITGGGPPAELWRSYMVQALPHLQVQKIPAGPAAPAGVVYGDPIGDLLSNTSADTPPSPETPDAAEPLRSKQPAPADPPGL
jgi:penicillin-binding protein 1A